MQSKIKSKLISDHRTCGSECVNLVFLLLQWYRKIERLTVFLLKTNKMKKIFKYKTSSSAVVPSDRSEIKMYTNVRVSRGVSKILRKQPFFRRYKKSSRIRKI